MGLRLNNAALVLAALAAADVTWGQPWAPGTLQRAEEGIGDVEPLRLNLRDMQVDLRRPAGFDSVFRFDRTDAFGQRETVFMRMDGGVTAVFPQSVYSPSAWGPVPTIPPGTTFYIGEVPRHLRPAEQPRPTPVNRIDMSVGGGAESPPPAAALHRPEGRPVRRAVPGARVQPSVWTDEAYRTRRIEALLQIESSP
jgi:hypothetical protein